MSKLLVATNNQGKIKEIKKILGGLYDEVLTFKDLGLSIETVEDGNTFMENARKKAVEAYDATGMDTLADDSGLCVDALEGAPGIYSARFAGEDANDESNNDLLIEKLIDVAPENKTAYFYCAVCLIRKSKPEIDAQGKFHGIIMDKRKGENGFGYDPLFFVPEYDKTYAELSPEVKNKISHRSIALNNLKRALENG